jgi:hypothetical protein
MRHAQAGLYLVFQLVRRAEQRWRRIDAPHLVIRVLEGASFTNGVEVTKKQSEGSPLEAIYTPIDITSPSGCGCKLAGERIPDFLTDRRFWPSARSSRRPQRRVSGTTGLRALRDRAIFELGLASLRIGAVLGIRLDGLFRLDQNQVKIRAKSGHERLQAIPDDAVAAVGAWHRLEP